MVRDNDIGTSLSLIGARPPKFPVSESPPVNTNEPPFDARISPLFVNVEMPPDVSVRGSKVRLPPGTLASIKAFIHKGDRITANVSRSFNRMSCRIGPLKRSPVPLIPLGPPLPKTNLPVPLMTGLNLSARSSVALPVEFSEMIPLLLMLPCTSSHVLFAIDNSCGTALASTVILVISCVKALTVTTTGSVRHRHVANKDVIGQARHAHRVPVAATFQLPSPLTFQILS